MICCWDGQKVSGKKMLTISKIPDSEAHQPGCMEADRGISCADPNLMYLDIFCVCHRYTEPKILGNGIDIAWPAGWTEQQARTWRAARGLKAPTEFVAEDETSDTPPEQLDRG